jgi:hypothetical protein
MNLRFDGASRTFIIVSGTQTAVRLAGACNNGMVRLTAAKGGQMFEATIGGQKLNFNWR